MEAHVQRICRTCYYQLRQLRSARRSLSFTACTSLVHAFITGMLDYCNSLLAGICVGLMSQLQSVIRVAARPVMWERKFDSISNDIRDRLDWFPVKQRVDFKLGLLVYKYLHGEAPANWTKMLEFRSDDPALHRLWNTANRGPGKLVVPRSRLKTFGPRSHPHGTACQLKSPTRHSTFQPPRSDSKHFYSNSLSRTKIDIIQAARAHLRWTCYKETLYKCPTHYITLQYV